MVGINSENTTLIIFNALFLHPYSSFADSKEHFQDFPLKNGGMSGAIELKQHVGAHCHGPKALVGVESGDSLLAKKKLYIASAVCLIFMIGEIIGKKFAVSEFILKDYDEHLKTLLSR